MSKSLTRTQINEKKFRRINDKSLRQLLIHRFLNDYGYDKGEVTATAIVDDILKTVEDYFVITLPVERLATGDSLPEERYLSYGHLVWMAVPIDEYPERGKSIVKTRMKPGYLAAEDIESFRNGFGNCGSIAWSAGVNSEVSLGTNAAKYPRCSSITLYLQGHLTPTIAAKTKHSKEAVDRYIRDYESVKVVRTATADIDKISHITRLSKRVISQYLDLIPQQHLQAIDENLANSSVKPLNKENLNETLFLLQ